MPKGHTPPLSAYLALCKPRVVALMLVTTLVGMLLAIPKQPSAMMTWQAWQSIFCGIIGIAFAASCGAVVNHVVDRKLDARMARTGRRPIPTGQVTPRQACRLACLLGVVGLVILIAFVNTLTALFTLASLVGYAVVYTVFLKHATPQNIVIGGLAGAMPPLLGWIAVTNHVDANALLLVLIIFTWTPAHFWALAIYRCDDYAKAQVPMLPVTHGIPFTKRYVLLYTVLLMAVTLLPFAINMNGYLYLVGASLLGVGFLYWAVRLYRCDEPYVALRTFHYSIVYLFLLFIVMLLDHYLV